ncbi:hypothetical protein [Leptospira sp. 'Mane']|uniref:hypothetical protein n=1 Tax=Leptospira sp. 'Mane' TaxID=3387407 RepID=UPI00398BA10C
MMKNIGILIFAILLTGANCQPASEKNDKQKLGFLALLYLSQYNNPDRPSVYFSSVRQFNLQVVYEENASPEIGNFILGGSSYWSVTEDNLKAIFADRGYTVGITVPNLANQMTSIPSQNKTTWTIPQILELANRYQTQRSDFQTARFFLVFVNGYLDNNGTPNTSVVGVNISGTPVTVIFKDVVRAFPSNQRPVAEQVTVVHEIGHALGLVNNGIPLSSSHQDTEHGKHCTNTTCGMYYEIEGRTSLNNFIQSYFSNSNKVVLKSECLDDIKNFKP